MNSIENLNTNAAPNPQDPIGIQVQTNENLLTTKPDENTEDSSFEEKRTEHSDSSDNLKLSENHVKNSSQSYMENAD